MQVWEIYWEKSGSFRGILHIFDKDFNQNRSLIEALPSPEQSFFAISNCNPMKITPKVLNIIKGKI